MTWGWWEGLDEVVVEGPGSGFGWVDGGVIYKGYGLEGWGADR